MRIAVENDQIELADAGFKQLAGRKGNQRHFVDRGAVLLFRWPQNRKMDQIDARIGFQHIAPDALADMRLARHQQHFQRIADAFDGHHRAVVERGQLVAGRLDLDLEHIGAGMGDGDRQFDVLIGPDPALGHHHAIAAGHGFDGPLVAAHLFHAEAHGQILADNAETRTVDQHDPPVMLLRVSGNQCMQGGFETEALDARFAAFGRVMHLTVGDQDRTRHPLGRHIGQKTGQSGKQGGAVGVMGGNVGDAHIQMRHLSELLLDLGAHGVGLALALVKLLRAGPVDHHRNHIIQRVAFLDDHLRLEQCADQSQHRHKPEPAAATSGADDHSGKNKPDNADEHNPRPWQQRRKAEMGHYCPSLSSKAGTCT